MHDVLIYEHDRVSPDYVDKLCTWYVTGGLVCLAGLAAVLAKNSKTWSVGLLGTLVTFGLLVALGVQMTTCESWLDSVWNAPSQMMDTLGDVGESATTLPGTLASAASHSVTQGLTDMGIVTDDGAVAMAKSAGQSGVETVKKGASSGSGLASAASHSVTQTLSDYGVDTANFWENAAFSMSGIHQ